jgi:hypothetical protein
MPRAEWGWNSSGSTVDGMKKWVVAEDEDADEDEGSGGKSG